MPELLEPLETKIIITGVPRAGKTYLSNRLFSQHDFASIRHSDAFVKRPWGDQSRLAAEWISETPAPYILEGVTMIRAVRKFIMDPANKNEKPCDLLIWLPTPRYELFDHQERLAKALTTVYNGIESQIINLGTRILNYGT